MRIIEGSGGDRVNITTAERVSERKRARRGGNKRREAKRREAMCEKRKSNFERVFTPAHWRSVMHTDCLPFYRSDKNIS